MHKFEYDAVIIGAGLGGLVCGCYLAMADYRVLIIEQHSKPGGYCTSFKRKGYKFDVGIHSLGGVNNGILSGVIDELGLREELRFQQHDPTDKIIMPDSTTYIRANPHDTIKEFIKTFPEEKSSIEEFFKFVMQESVMSIYAKVRNLNIGSVLDKFFHDERLKASISILFLSNIGLPQTEVAAFAAIVFLREFILDPGYVPGEGIDQFTECLVRRFKGLGGELILSRKVTEIIYEDNIAIGVTVDAEERIMSKLVVSAIDATQTFTELIHVKTRETEIIKSLVPSNSIFAVYLGMKTPVSTFFNERCNIWYFMTYDIDGSYRFLSENLADINITGMLISFPSMKAATGAFLNNTVQILTIATYETADFWSQNRDALREKLITLAERVVPGLSRNIDVAVTATPHSFHRYTLNKNGAAYGWAPSVNQIDSTLLPHRTSVENLFLTGHWCTMGAGQGGVSTVALSGKRAAETIINQFNRIDK